MKNSTPKKPAGAPRKRIPPQSLEKAQQAITYGRLTKLIRPTWTHCARCALRSDPDSFEAHHPYKRGKGKAGWKMFVILPLCRSCHTWCHENENQARAGDWILDPQMHNPYAPPA